MIHKKVIIAQTNIKITYNFLIITDLIWGKTSANMLLRLTVSERLSAFSLCSFKACCKARISALCSLTASSTAWRDSELRWSARSLWHPRCQQQHWLTEQRPESLHHTVFESVYDTCSASHCPTVSAGLLCVSQLGFFHLPRHLSKPPTAVPSPATHRSGTPAPPPAPPACCKWSSTFQCSGRKN